MPAEVDAYLSQTERRFVFAGWTKKDNKPYLCFAYGMHIGITHFLISKHIANTYPYMLMAKATKHR